MLVSGSRLFTGLKRRPASYKASDAAYTVGGNRGSYIAWLPRDYPLTPQQRKLKKLLMLVASSQV